MKNELKANLTAACSIFLWCFSGACFRRGSELFGSMSYLSMICAGGALTAFIIQIASGRNLKAVLNVPLKAAIAGFFGVAVYTIMLAAAFAMAEPQDIGLINLINYLWPVWIIIFQILVLKTEFKKIFLFSGIVSGFAGIFIAGNFSFTVCLVEVKNLFPHILAFTGALMWALYSVLLKKWNIPEDKGGTVLNFGICSVIAAVIVFINGDASDFVTHWNVKSLFWVLFGSVGPVGAAYYLWEMGIKRGSVSFIAALSYFIPLGSSAVLAVLFHETMNYGLFPGAVLIILGAYLVRKSSAARPVLNLS